MHKLVMHAVVATRELERLSPTHTSQFPNPSLGLPRRASGSAKIRSAHVPG